MSRDEHTTTADELMRIRSIIKATLWKIATEGDLDQEYTEEQGTAIQVHAQNLFQSSSWIDQTVGEVAAKLAQEKLSQANLHLDH